MNITIHKKLSKFFTLTFIVKIGLRPERASSFPEHVVRGRKFCMYVCMYVKSGVYERATEGRERLSFWLWFVLVRFWPCALLLLTTPAPIVPADDTHLKCLGREFAKHTLGESLRLFGFLEAEPRYRARPVLRLVSIITTTPLV